MEAPTLEDLVADRTTVRESIVTFGGLKPFFDCQLISKTQLRSRRQLRVAIVIIVVVALIGGIEENPDDVVSLAVGPKEESWTSSQ